MTNDLFKLRSFTAHSGGKLEWEIDCNALSETSLDALAAIFIAWKPLPFGRVIGIIRGGLRFAAALERYVTPGAPGILIADDVLTTGTSILEAINDLTPEDRLYAHAVVIFDRSEQLLPLNIVSLFQSTAKNGRKKEN